MKRLPGIVNGGLIPLVLASNAWGASYAGQLSGHNVPVSGRTKAAFDSLWAQPSEDMKGSVLCLGVQIGTSGGRTVEEVARFSPAKENNKNCKQAWLYAFHGEPFQGGDLSGGVIDLLVAYGLETPPRSGKPTTLDEFVTYASEADSLDRAMATRLRRLCRDSRGDTRCKTIYALARSDLSGKYRKTEYGFTRMNDQGAILAFWATAAAPEPSVLHEFRQNPGREWRADNLAFAVLEDWNDPEIRNWARTADIWDVAFRQQIQDLKPAEDSDGGNYCIAQSLYEDARLLYSWQFNMYRAFCSANPTLLARYTWWKGYAKDSDPSFSLSEDRPLVRFLASTVGKINNQYGRETLARLIGKIAVAGKDRWTVQDIPALNRLSGTVQGWNMPQDAEVVRSVATQASGYASFRAALLLALAYLAVWSVCLALYPHFRWIQGNVFWHPRLRKVFFALNWLLISLPFLRRRMFVPFRAGLQPSTELLEGNAPYFGESKVLESGSEKTLLAALPYVRGRVVLEGESGLGKSTYLRRLAREALDPVIYVEAKACRKGVIDAIADRLPGWLRDKDFLASLIFQGGMTVIIDGLNEVGPSIRSTVLTFLGNSASAAIGTQPIDIEWPSNVRALELQPLDPGQAERFLVTQGVPEDRVRSFMATALSTNQHPRDLRASQIVLSNPFDLSVVAEMLNRGSVPNLLTLAEQHYDAMATRFQELENYPFPKKQFAEHVYDNVLSDQAVLNNSAFSRELRVMASVRMVIDRNGSFTFRHDKIRDYFLVTALTSGDRLFEHFDDSRFASAYLSLALKLPADQAIDVRDRLAERAVDHGDHELADAFRRMLRRRSDLPPQPRTAQAD